MIRSTQNANHKLHQERRIEYVSSCAKLNMRRDHLRNQMEGLHHMWYHTEASKMPVMMSDLSFRIKRIERVSLEG